MAADPEGIRRLAAGTRLQADRVQAMAARVRVLGGLRWRSPAADLFRLRVAARARSLDESAEQARLLASALEALAADLEQDGRRGP
jgi:hypothetical protein